MDNVIALTPKPLLVFVCDCGCASRLVMSDGSTECASCGAIGEETIQGCADLARLRPEYEGDPFIDHSGNGSADFARHVVKSAAADKDAVLVVVAKEDGALTTWSDAGSDAQVDWVEEKLQLALELIRKNVAVSTD